MQAKDASHLKAGEEVFDVSELVVDHKSKHTHLGGTSLVELDGTLGKLGFLIERIPSEVKGSVSEVSDVFVSGSLDVLHNTQLQGTNEGEDLKGSGNGNSEGGIPSVSKIRELGARVVNVSWKVDSGSVDEVSDNSKHADTSVLDLDVTKTVELVLVTVGNNAKRVEESKRSLGTKLVFECHVGGDRSSGGILSGSKGGGSGDEGGKDSRLHFVDCLLIIDLDH